MYASVTKASPLCLQYPGEIMKLKNIIVPIATGLCLWLAVGILVFEYWWEYVEIFLFAYQILSIFPKFSSHLPYIQWISLVLTIAIIGLALIDMKVRRGYAV